MRQTVDDGYPVVVAAGNEGGNSCAFSPSGCRQSVSVGSEDELDQVAGFSNTGHCVTLFAPGTQVCETPSLAFHPAKDHAGTVSI